MKILYSSYLFKAISTFLYLNESQEKKEIKNIFELEKDKIVNETNTQRDLLDIQISPNENKEILDEKPRFVVILGDSNMAGSVSMANILAAQDDKFTVYREAKSSRPTNTILYDLQHNQETIDAIKNADDLIFWAGGNSLEHAVDPGILKPRNEGKKGGLQKIYELIKEINPDINLIVFDIQNTKRNKTTQQKRNLYVNKTNEKLSFKKTPDNKDLIDWHIQTNDEFPLKKNVIDRNHTTTPQLEYVADGAHLTTKTKKEITIWLMEKVFRYKATDEIGYAKPFENNSDEFVKRSKESKTYNENYKPSFEELYLNVDKKKQTIKYKKGNKTFEFPIYIDPLKANFLKDNFSVTEEQNLFMLKTFRAKNMPSEIVEEETQKLLKFEKYISTLPLKQRLQIQFLVRSGAEIVQYKEHIFNPKKRNERRNYRRTPDSLKTYTKKITYYKKRINEETGEEYLKKFTKTVPIKTIDNLSVLYDMAIICTEMEEAFPQKYDSQSLFVTMLSVGSVETMLNAGIQREGYLESLEGSTKDFGMFQLNYYTAKNYLMKNNPEFWSQFFSIAEDKKKIIFKSNHGEILTFAYMLQLLKLKDGLPKNGDFNKMAHEVAAWHSRTPHRRKIYGRELNARMKQYYEVLEKNFDKNDKKELLNEITRQELLKKYYQGNKKSKLPKDALGIINDFIINDQSLLNKDYPPARDKTLVKISKEIPFNNHFSELSTPALINNLVIEKISSDQANNPNTNLWIDKYGDINLYLKKPKKYTERQTAYSTFQNRIPIAIRYTNKRLNKRNEELLSRLKNTNNTQIKHEINEEIEKERNNHLLLCAEKGGEIFFLNDVISLEQVPADVKNYLINKYGETEAQNLFTSEIDFSYKIIFGGYQEMGYRIEVRVGNEKKFKQEINNANRINNPKEFKKLKSHYPHMTDEKYFEDKNLERPRFIVPFDQPILPSGNNQYFVFTDYFEGLQRSAQIEASRKKQREKLKSVTEEIQEQSQ